MWVKTNEVLIDAYVFKIEEVYNHGIMTSGYKTQLQQFEEEKAGCEIRGFNDFELTGYRIVAIAKGERYIIGNYNNKKEAQMVLEYCWDSLRLGDISINASTDFIDRYVLRKVTEEENFDVRR